MSLKIHPRPGVEVFVNRQATITLKQLGSDDPNDPTVYLVTIHPDDVEKLVQLLYKARTDAADAVPEEDDDKESAEN